jgi:hypothetical protein
MIDLRADEHYQRNENKIIYIYIYIALLQKVIKIRVNVKPATPFGAKGGARRAIPEVAPVTFGGG